MSMPTKILVVDDDEKLLKSLRTFLSLKNHSVDTTSNPLQVERLLETHDYNCILLDVKMPGMSGLDLLKNVLQKHPSTPVIMISGQSNIKTAVQSIKDGAYDFVEKPIDPERLFVVAKNAIQKKTLLEEKDTIFQALQEKCQMIGESPAIKEIFRHIEQVANTHAKVLVVGESGTGKELVAWAIHHTSERRGKRYVKVNCATIPANLIESELFGHEKGAFTGALSQKVGRFERANGGTIFLDEIGDLPLELQVKLLRVLQEGEFERVGGQGTTRVDVRVIAATNQDLERMVSEGKFREDLYYRLNVVKITIPPLRERVEDILPLAYHFLREFNNSYNKQVLAIKRQAAALLMNYHWPGNVRELRNVLEKLVIYSQKKEISIDDVQGAMAISNNSTHTPLIEPDDQIVPLKNATHNFERNYILTALQKLNWKINDTADALGIERSNLFKKRQKYGI